MAEDLDIDDFIDTSPVTRLHLVVAVFGTLVMFVDGFNIQVIGYIAPQLAKDWQIPKQLLGPIFSSGLFGVFCGYLALAPLTSRIGHRKMLIACTVTLGVLTLSTMLVRDAYSLMALRFLTGLALGAANPSAVSIIADFSPRHRRSTFVVIGICGISLGSMFAGLATTVLLESFGWQAVVFVGGAMPLVLAVGLFASLPDSLEYSVRRRNGSHAATLALARRIAPGRELHDDTRFVPHEKTSGAVTQLFVQDRLVGTSAVWLCFTANLLVNYFVQSWLTTMLITAGHSQRIAVIGMALFAAGGTISIFALGPLMDRFQPFRIISLFFVLGGVSVALLGRLISSSDTVVLAACFASGLFILGVQKGMNAIAVYFYPTTLRSTGLGWGLGIGRIGAVSGPLIAGFLMQGRKEMESIFYISAIPMLFGGLIMYFTLRYYGDRRLARKRMLSPADTLG